MEVLSTQDIIRIAEQTGAKAERSFNIVAGVECVRVSREIGGTIWFFEETSDKIKADSDRFIRRALAEFERITKSQGLNLSSMVDEFKGYLLAQKHFGVSLDQYMTLALTELCRLVEERLSGLPPWETPDLTPIETVCTCGAGDRAARWDKKEGRI